VSKAITYTVNILVNNETLDYLYEGGFFLYALRKVRSSNKSGLPLIAFKTGKLTNKVEISWTDSLSAFISTTPLPSREEAGGSGKHAPVVVGSLKGISIGKKLTVSKTMTTEVVDGNDLDNVSFSSNYEKTITCGLYDDTQGEGESVSGDPVCAFSLARGLDVLIKPKNEVFLMFMTADLEVGAWLRYSVGSGVLVVPKGNSELSINFDKENNWASIANATIFSTGTDLRALMIVPPDPGFLGA